MTTEEFDAAIQSKKTNNGSTLQWRDLPTGEILYVEQRKQLNLKDGTCMILTLTNSSGDTYTAWATKRLCDELIQDHKEVDVFIRSNGLKQSKTDPTRSYYDYDIINEP